MVFRNRRLSRRTVLKGMGVSLGLPLLDAMHPAIGADSNQAVPRAVFLYVPNGVNIAKWVPETTGRDYQFSPTLEVLSDHREQLSVLSGLGHPNSKGGHSGADTWLTGANLEGTSGYDYRNSISVDQVAAEVIGQETRYSSIQLSSSGGTGKPGHSHTLSFSRDAVPLPAERSPMALFRRLFVPNSHESQEATRARFSEDQSILDYVLEQAGDLRHELGNADQQKLDEYLSSVRDVEQRVQRMEAWIDVPKPEVDADELALSAEPNQRGDRATYFRVMFDLIRLAFESDLTRICTFELGREAAGGDYAELGLNANHHELSHHGGDSDMLEGLFKIDRFLLQQLSYFLTSLHESNLGSDSLLEQTIVLYGSGMNSGEGGGHSPKNLPLLLAGGGAIGMQHGHHLRFEEDSVPLSNLYVSILQALGLETDSFMDSSGTLNGIG